jgi:hypothetical protein
MNNAQHTPGPWVYEKTGYVKSEGCYIAEVLHGPDCPDVDEVKENARLIAAAPDLLKALEACEEIMRRAIGDRLPILKGTYCEEEDWQAALRKARSAIAKAKGVQA